MEDNKKWYKKPKVVGLIGLLIVFVTWLFSVPILLIPFGTIFVWKFTEWRRGNKLLAILGILILYFIFTVKIPTQSPTSSQQDTQATPAPLAITEEYKDSPKINQQKTNTQSRQKYLETMGGYEGEILDVFKNEINSDIFTELGNHEIALRIKRGRDKLINIKVKTIATDLPGGTETAHKHFNNAIDLYIEAARKFQEGVEFSDVSVLKNASAIKSQAWDEQTVAWKLLGIN